MFFMEQHAINACKKHEMLRHIALAVMNHRVSYADLVFKYAMARIYRRLFVLVILTVRGNVPVVVGFATATLAEGIWV